MWDSRPRLSQSRQNPLPPLGLALQRVDRINALSQSGTDFV